MKNIFQKSSSNWVKYDKYEWRTATNGKCYITPSADAKPSIYNPIKDYEKLVLTAINIGTTAMNKASEAELKDAIMGFVSEYGMLGLMRQSICQRIILSRKKASLQRSICPTSSLLTTLISAKWVWNPVGVRIAWK